MSAIAVPLPATMPALVGVREPGAETGPGNRVVEVRDPPRMKELDALRGLAAVTVVLDHFYRMWIADSIGGMSGWVQKLALVLTPLYSGRAAVMLFFVLSGFVLTLPFERGKSQPYAMFFVRRVTRIYLPYLGALTLALVGNCIWHGPLRDGITFWLRAPTLALILQHIGLIGVYDTNTIDGPVWSLVYEMRISLIFPALLLLTKKLGAMGSGVLAMLLTIAAGWVLIGHPEAARWRQSGAGTLEAASFFILGILLARYYRVLLPKTRVGAIALVSCAGFLFFYGFYPLSKVPLHHVNSTVYLMVWDWVMALGAVGLIVGFVARPKVLLHRTPQFAGRISYSLYLLHQPVLLAVTFASGSLSPWVQFPLYLALSVSLATVFCLRVEEPATRWGRSLRFGKSLARSTIQA